MNSKPGWNQSKLVPVRENKEHKVHDKRAIQQQKERKGQHTMSFIKLVPEQV